MFSRETLESSDACKHMFKDALKVCEWEKSETGKTGADFVPGYVCHYQAHGACSTFHSLSTPPIFSLLISIVVYMMCR